MTITEVPQISQPASTRAQVWSGRVLSGIATLFLTLDAVVHVVRPAAAVEATTKLGFPAAVLLPLGMLQLAFIAAYLVPRTRIIGAILWTGYLGGAVAAHVRVGDPLATHILMPVYVAAVLWAGLALRDAGLRSILNGTRSSQTAGASANRPYAMNAATRNIPTTQTSGFVAARASE